MGLILDDIHKDAAIGFLMVPSGGKVHIPRDILTRLDGNLGEDVLCAPSLMGGDQMGNAEDFLHRLLQMLKVLAPGIGLVAQHQPSPLLIAHGVGATVGKQVDVDIFGVNKEGVVTGLLDNPFPLLSGCHLHRLYAFNTERFCWKVLYIHFYIPPSAYYNASIVPAQSCHP